MDPEVPLCIPEVNLSAAKNRPKGIIANPNCSTIQMLVALKPIHDISPLRRVVVTTYQAASGAGAHALQRLRDQWKGLSENKPIDPTTHREQLAGNVLMHWSRDVESGYQEEELKLIHESRKILNAPELSVSPTTVRVAVETGHSEAITLECEQPIDAARVRRALEQAPGVRVMDDFAQGWYPTPLDVVGRDEVLVGRIRNDLGNPGGVQLWVVGDNLRKGAALNAVQIVEGLIDL